MPMDYEDLENINPDNLDEDDWELKFWIWGRKIYEMVLYMEEQNFSYEEIRNYLQKCADLREKWLDPNDLTEVEEHWSEEMTEFFEFYHVIDPIWEIRFK